MTTINYLFGVAAALLVLGTVITLLLKRRLRERHSVWWLAIGVAALIVAAFPGTLEFASRVVGVQLPITLVLFVGIIVLFLVSVQQSTELTGLEEQTRVLAEEHALLSERVMRLEAESETRTS